MRGPASPYAITQRHRSPSSGARRVYGSPLCRPPSSSTNGRSIACTATNVDATLVALESLIHSTPPTSRTRSSRFGSAANERSPSASTPGATPASWAASAAASAFATLWSPSNCRSPRRISTAPPSRSTPAAASYQASAGPRSENRTRRPRTAPRQVEHRLVVAVQHPELVIPRVVEDQALVRVIRLDRRVAVEVVGREVRDDTDVGQKVGTVVQLERRHLDHEPLVGIALQRRFGERAPDVAHGFGAQPGRAQQVRHQGGRRRLAVGAGDRDAATGDEPPEPDVDLRHDRYAGAPRGHEGRRVRGNARRRHHGRREADPGEIVAPDLHHDAGQCPQLRESIFTPGVVRRVARIHANPRVDQQPRRGDAAPPETHHGDFAAPPGVRDHRTFRVARAIAAHSTPRM